MATGSDSTHLGSEDHNTEEILCTPCLQDQKRTDPEKYCQTCLQNFCTECLQQHNRFNGMRDHILSEKKDTRSIHVDSTRYKCKTHTNMSLEIYCQDCNQLSCSIGAATDHRNCATVEYLPTEAKQISKRSEFKDVKESLYKVREQLEVLERSREHDGEQIDVKACEVEEMISNHTGYINGVLDKLEAKAKYDNNLRQTKIQERVQRDITMIQDKLKQIKDEINTIEHNISDDVRTFINMKKAEKIPKTLENFIQDKSSKQKEEVNFKINVQLLEILSSIDQFGYFTRQNILWKESKLTGDITGFLVHETYILQLIKGGIVKDSSLIKLDKYLDILDALKLEGIPKGMCAVSNKQVAVTFPFQKCVQLISIHGKLTVTLQIDLDFKPYGIGYMNDKLYITRKQFLATELKVLVHDIAHTSGHTMNIDCGYVYAFDNPSAIATDETNGLIHIAIEKKGIVMINQALDHWKTMNYPDLGSPKAICMGNTGTLYIGGQNAIYKTSSDLQNLLILLDESDGIKNPTQMCFDKEECKLYVVMETGILKVYV